MWDLTELVRSFGLLLVLLNPFLVIVYLTDVVEKLDARRFGAVLTRAGIISTGVFCVFAVLGDAFFSDVVHADFARNPEVRSRQDFFVPHDPSSLTFLTFLT